MSGFYKAVSGLAMFFSIRLLINYLGAENYGLWVLVFTLFQLVLLMDFGLQSSLKTTIPLILKENNIEKLKVYIKTNYYLTIALAFLIFILFVGVILFFNLSKTFKINLLN
jgi:O-antigen/teichoic acid export membrane protein